MSTPPPRQSDRAFGLTIAAALLVVGAVGWLIFDVRLYWIPILAGFLAVTALATPWLLLPINRLWSVLAEKLGWVSNRLVLGAFFLVCVVPVGLFMRLAKRDPLHRGWDRSAGTYFVPVRRQASGDTLRDQF